MSPTPSPRKSTSRSIGGIPFFCTLLATVFVAMIHCGVAVHLLLSLLTSEASGLDSAGLVGLAIGVAVGVWFAAVIITGKRSVLLHEVKHSLLSGFAGNAWKRMHVEDKSGYFEYSYSQRSAKFNALISMAPYFLPVFTLTGTLLMWLEYLRSQTIVIPLLGIGYGVDLLTNVRDISPKQPDFFTLTGGFPVGLLFVAAANATLLATVLIYALCGSSSLVVLADAYLFVGDQILARVRG